MSCWGQVARPIEGQKIRDKPKYRRAVRDDVAPPYIGEDKGSLSTNGIRLRRSHQEKDKSRPKPHLECELDKYIMCKYLNPNSVRNKHELLSMTQNAEDRKKTYSITLKFLHCKKRKTHFNKFKKINDNLGESICNSVSLNMRRVPKN